MPGTTPPYWRLFVQYKTLRSPRVRSGSTVRMRATLSHLPSPATSSENNVVDVMGYCGAKHKLPYPPNGLFFRLIHPSARKAHSRNFASRGFSEIAVREGPGPAP